MSCARLEPGSPVYQTNIVATTPRDTDVSASVVFGSRQFGPSQDVSAKIYFWVEQSKMFRPKPDSKLLLLIKFLGIVFILNGSEKSLFCISTI